MAGKFGNLTVANASLSGSIDSYAGAAMLLQMVSY